MKEDAVKGAVSKAVKNRQPRKFHYDCENFAILAKLGNFARLAKFRYIAKITMPSEILHFRYLSQISLG